MINILSCGTKLRGHKKYCCENEFCPHHKTVCHSCNCRTCPTCGKRATDHWIAQLVEILPDTPHQHITFTMPDTLWAIFHDNRELLKDLQRMAAEVVLELAKERDVLPCIFTALHTFGRALNWNTHVHLSVTMGGLTSKDTWKSIRFYHNALMTKWRYKIITYLREKMHSGELSITNQHLDAEYSKHWIVHLAKPTKDSKRTVKYLGRYVKRAAIGMSRLLHYDGHTVKYRFLDHKTKKHKLTEIDAMAFLDLFTQHIPDKGFRMIRYYGALANRVRTKCLAKIYDLLNQTMEKPKILSWAHSMYLSFGYNPMRCMLCGGKMLLREIKFGVSFQKIKEQHYALATGGHLRY
jgi:hypothetical protein